MLKEKLNKIYKYHFKGKTLSLIGILVIVLSLPVALTLLRQRTTYKIQAVVEPVDLSFSPSSQTLPPDSTFRIMVNARTNNISFARVVFTFDRTKVNLVSEITTTSAMGTVVERTPRTNANSTGRATLVLAVPPGVTLPTGTFEFARFNLTRISTTANDTTQLQFTQSDIQVVDTTAEAAPSYSFTNASLTLNPTLTPTPTAGVTLTPTPLPTATVTPTPTYTPTPTPAAGVTILLNQATGQTCRQVCASADPYRYMECRSVGTDTQALNNGAIIYSGSCITLTSGMSCDARMNNTGQICSGNQANWTRCRCE